MPSVGDGRREPARSTRVLAELTLRPKARRTKAIAATEKFKAEALPLVRVKRDFGSVTKVW